MAAEHTFSADDSIIQEELEVLESIYIDELEVDINENGRPSSITLQLHPSTGEDVHKKFVCMTLTLNIPVGYPNELPEILIRNPRGVGEEELESLHEAINELAEDRRGGHMLYDIIELAKESLTEGNVPHCPCTICLDHFCEGEEFTRTGCYHYFHRHCLYRYVTHTLESLKSEANLRPKHGDQGQDDSDKVLCPVCREVMNYDLDILALSKDQIKDDHNKLYKPSAEMCRWQVEMAAILESQKEKGGIIDLEAEKNKFLVTAEDTVHLPSQGTNPELDNLGKSDSKESRLAVDNKPITVQGKGQSAVLHGTKRERGNRQDHPRPSSGHTDRHQRYRGHRNYGQEGHRSHDGRYRGGHKVYRSHHTGQGQERERKTDHDKDKRYGGNAVQSDVSRSDRTDAVSGSVSSRNEEREDGSDECETARKMEVENRCRTADRISVGEGGPKPKQTNEDTSAINENTKQDIISESQENIDNSGKSSPGESVEKLTEKVSLDSDKGFHGKRAPSSGSKTSPRTSNKTNYRESKNSEHENRNYHQGRNDDRERGHFSRGRDQGRRERGCGRGSRRSANQELVKSRPELEKIRTDPHSDTGTSSSSHPDKPCDSSEGDSHGSKSAYKGKDLGELGFQRPNSGYKGRNRGFGRPNNRTQNHYDSYSKHGKSEGREISSKKDKGEVNFEGDRGRVTQNHTHQRGRVNQNHTHQRGRVTQNHTHQRGEESAGTNITDVKPGGKHHTETRNQKRETLKNNGDKTEMCDDRFVQDHKHWNKNKESHGCNSRNDNGTEDSFITDKGKPCLPSCRVKRLPPGFAQVEKLKNDVKVPPGFEKLGISG